MRALDVADLFQSVRMTWTTEADLQAELKRALDDQQYSSQREVSLDHVGEPLGRIDLLVEGGVGVEVKVGSRDGWVDVTRQLMRYARSPLVEELLLVTTTARHRLVPPVVGGKHVMVLFLLEAGL